MTPVVLVHGWGYDASLWERVRALLLPEHPVVTLDFRFYGTVPPAPTFAVPVLAVGHSLGALWWLAQSAIPWSRLLAINGFPRFTETDGYAPAVAPRLLTRMQAQFAREPEFVLADFHARCGGQAPAGRPDLARLAAGLGWLADWDGREMLAARRAEVSALAASDDPIVPQAMSAMAWGEACATVDTAGHLLPLTHPEVCADWIERLAA